MSMKIRLARGGSKKRPHYSIVASDSRMPRDGRFLEKLGTYDPMLAKDNENRIKMDLDRIKDWLSKGAQPTDRVARFLEAAGALPKTVRSNPKSAVLGKAMAERAKKKAAAAEAPAEVKAPVVAAAPEVVEAPAVVEALAAVEAPEAEASVEEAPVEEATAEEASAAE